MRMLAPALRRHISDRAFQDLQKRLLHAFARHVAGNRRVLILAANLVDLIDVDDALLRAFDVAIRSLQEFQDNVLDVFADITRFGQGSCIDDGKGNAEHARQRLCQQSLARARGPDEHNVRFLNLNVSAAASQLDSLVVLIDGDRQLLLCFFLPNNVLVKKRLNLAGLRQRRSRRYRLSLLVVGDDLVTNVDTLIADVDRRSGNEFLDFVLRLAAEGTAQGVVSSSYHVWGTPV